MTALTRWLILCGIAGMTVGFIFHPVDDVVFAAMGIVLFMAVAKHLGRLEYRDEVRSGKRER